MSDKAQKRLALWETASGMVVGSCLSDPALIRTISEDLPDSSLLHPTYAPAYAALLQLVDGESVITPELVAEVCGADISLLTAVQISAEDEGPEKTASNAKVIVRVGKEFTAKNIFQQAVDGTLTGEEAVAKFQSLENYGFTQRDTSANALADDFIESLDHPVGDNASTGIVPLDHMTWAMPKHEITVLAAEYKNGKSRIAQNISLGAASRGTPVLYVMAEGDRRWFTARAVAMIVAYLMRLRGTRLEKDETFPSAGILLHRAKQWRSNPKWRGLVDEALAIYRRLPIHVIDPADGATDPHRAALEVKKHIHNQQVRLVILDYIGDMDFGADTDYEAQQRAKPYIKQLAMLGVRQGLGAHLVVLSQRNEESIKSGSDRHGMKGGGDLAAVANNVLVQVQTELEDGSYEYKINAPRVRDNASGMTMRLHAHREAGLVTGFLTGSGVIPQVIDLLNLVDPAQGAMELD